MSSVLAIAALALLASLGVLSVKRQRATAASEKQRTGARSHLGDAQHDRSMARRAETRSASEQEREELPQDASVPRAAP